MEYVILEEKVKSQLDAQTLEENFVPFLIDNNFTVSTAESLTAGLISGTVANIPGSSAVLELGLITYNEGYKNIVLNVSRETLSKHSAVSFETCTEMLDGLSKLSNSNLLIAATGYAGPGENAGLVYLGIDFKGNRKIYRLNLQGERNQVRKKVVNLAFSNSMKLIREVEGYKLNVNKIFTV